MLKEQDFVYFAYMFDEYIPYLQSCEEFFKDDLVSDMYNRPTKEKKL